MLVLAHREELLTQAAAHIARGAPHLTVVVESGGRDPCDLAGADVVVASVPALGRASSARLARFNPAQFKAVVIDEAHHAAAATYVR